MYAKIFIFFMIVVVNVLASEYGKPNKQGKNLKFSSNLSKMFTEAPKIIDRYQLAANAGFKAVESGFPLGFSVHQVAEARRKANVKQTLIDAYTGNLTKGELGFAAIPGKEREFVDSIELTLQYAKALQCKQIHVMAGTVNNRTRENDIVYERNIRYAVRRHESENILTIIEPVNNLTRPNYYLNDFEKALNIVKKINNKNLKIMIDTFHLQLNGGKITYTMEKFSPYIGHIQIAQVPLRDEPDNIGELDYRYVFPLLEKYASKVFIGLEYTPRTNTSDGLKWIKEFGFTL